jgi:hypothetical protein
MSKKTRQEAKGTLVYHLIHVTTPFRHIPKLVIKDYFASKEEINRAGYWFGEFGIPWANHYVLHFKSKAEIPTDAIPAIMAGMDGEGDVEILTKEEFLEKLEKLF